MPITYDIEKDGLYKKGVLKGIEQAEEKWIIRGVKKTLLAIKYLKEGKTIKEIVILSGLTQKIVREIKKQTS